MGLRLAGSLFVCVGTAGADLVWRALPDVGPTFFAYESAIAAFAGLAMLGLDAMRRGHRLTPGTPRGDMEPRLAVDPRTRR